MSADQLKARLKEREGRHTEPSRVRLHRAISWLRRAEQEQAKDLADDDASFIFLWIAFNAAYAREIGIENSERDELRGFISGLLAVDSSGRLQDLVNRTFTGPIRTLIENRFVFEPFWRALRSHDSSGRWEGQFASSRTAAMKSVLAKDTSTVLSIIFDRLYVLRNQLVHGGATWQSKVNRQQVEDGARLLGSLLPVMIELMVDHPETDFGEILYPVVQ